MAFKFKITKVEKLPRAGLGVLAGTIVDGHVTTGQQLTLVHDGKNLPLKVTGVMLDSSRNRPNALAISFKLNQQALDLAQAGDELVSTT